LKAFILDRCKDFVTSEYSFRKPRRGWVLSRWYKIINDYCARRFSGGEDVFPGIAGIAGIAENVGDQLGLTYTAGIWQEDMHRGLLWRVPEGSEGFESYRAPSWTWASVAPGVVDAVFKPDHYPFFFFENEYNFDADAFSPLRRAGATEVMDVHIPTVDGDRSPSARPLPGSYLFLRGSCSRAQDWGMRSELNFYIHPHERVGWHDDYRGRIAIDLDSMQYRSLFLQLESNIWFLLITDTAVDTFDIRRITDKTLWRLVLRSYDLDGECRYVRIGVATMVRSKDLPELEWEERLVKIY
jgi:hypothetical protein